MSVTANKQAVLEIRFRLESAEGTLLLEKAIIQSSAMGETTPEQYVRAQSANLAAATATFSQLLPTELKLAR
jgi:hypothetical protein